MTLQLLLVNRQLRDRQGLLCLLDCELIYLRLKLALRLDELLPQRLDVAVFLLKLRLRLRRNLLLDAHHFLENVNVLLESLRDLIILLQLVRQENFHAAQRL